MLLAYGPTGAGEAAVPGGWAALLPREEDLWL